MPSEFAEHWTLDPAIAFLNHGSFGAAPRPVLAAQQAWRERMEAEPVRFFSHELEPALDRARTALGAFVGADPDDLAFVPNATAGTNTMLRSLEFRPGDELLTTDHAYNAAKNAMEFAAQRDGARVVIAPIAFPGATPEAVMEGILAAVTSRTRLAVLDHVTSATALVFPIQRVVAELTERGVETLVDGAHAPGQVELDVPSIGATYYTANLHKWVCAPKGSGFIWVRPDHQAAIRPLSISHGANSTRTDRSRFRVEFDWTGTADPSAYLSVVDAIRFGEELMPGGWAALRARNHDLALAGRDRLVAALLIDPPAPDEMIGTMASVPLPIASRPGTVQGIDLYDDPVHDHLAGLAMQVMVTPWPQRPGDGPWRRLVRISAAAYNDLEQFERLAAALPGALAAAA
ncbi:MAG TPA: aminotransferase class V-fold PLP-dependent enzyme [Methylomirabilota bacterium]|nr:aminotransferase class V-fold PLP-dependent enzyme [Methylomirabilota bacterium]